MLTVSQRWREFFRRRLPLILGIYIVIQPLLDALTTPSANRFAPISVGVVVRTLFMVFAFLYVVFVSRFKEKKYVMIYLGALVVYIILFLGLMFYLGGFRQGFSNLKELVKVFFLPFAAAFLFAIYREYGYRVSSRSIAWAGSLYAFVILFAYLTHTSLVSYRSGFGYKGWFYAANEVGCIIGVAAPVAIWYCLKILPGTTKKTWWKAALAVVSLISIAFAANYIGTKIIFAAVLVYCLTAFVWCLFHAIRERKKGHGRSALVMGVMTLVVAVMFLSSPLSGYLRNVYFKLLPIGSEIVVDHYASGETDLPDEYDEFSGQYTGGLAGASEGTWLRELIAENDFVQKMDSILSRRLLTASPAVQGFIDGSIATKLLGVGYANSLSYGRDIHFMIELDGLSMLIRQGVLGFLLCFLPYLAAVIYAVVAFFKHPLKRLSSLKYCSYLYALLIAFGIAMIAGHVLGAPAVGTFMLVVTVNLLIMTYEQDKGLEIEVLN